MRFLQFIPGEDASFLRENHPNAFLLLSLIAERARRKSGHPDGLQIGDAILGDYQSAGLSRQQYRTALDTLVELGYIDIIYNGKTFLKREKSTIKSTITGTLVNLKDSRIWDINPEDSNQHINQRATNEQPTSNHKQERIRRNNKEEEEQTHGLRAVGCDVVIPFDFKKSSSREEIIIPQDRPVFRTPSFQKRNPEHEPNFDPKKEKKGYGVEENVMLTESQYEDLLKEMPEKERHYWIDQISLGIGTKGEKEFNKRYVSHYHTILSWKIQREERNVAFRMNSKNSKLSTEENKKYSEEIKKTHASHFYNIDILSKGVELTPKSGTCLPDCLDYSVNGFQDQLNNLLIKRKFVKKHERT
jgi:hypothetical protein